LKQNQSTQNTYSLKFLGLPIGAVTQTSAFSTPQQPPAPRVSRPQQAQATLLAPQQSQQTQNLSDLSNAASILQPLRRRPSTTSVSPSLNVFGTLTNPFSPLQSEPSSPSSEDEAHNQGKVECLFTKV